MHRYRIPHPCEADGAAAPRPTRGTSKGIRNGLVAADDFRIAYSVPLVRRPWRCQRDPDFLGRATDAGLLNLGNSAALLATANILELCS